MTRTHGKLAWGSIGMLLCLTGCLELGCAVVEKPEVEVGVTAEISAALASFRKEMNVGDIGGGGDSIALWLAITALAVSSVMGAVGGGKIYEHVFRPRRIKRENKS